MAEHQAKVLQTEATRMLSTKNDQGASRGNYVGLLELEDELSLIHISEPTRPY